MKENKKSVKSEKKVKFEDSASMDGQEGEDSTPVRGALYEPVSTIRRG